MPNQLCHCGAEVQTNYETHNYLINAYINITATYNVQKLSNKQFKD